MKTSAARMKGNATGPTLLAAPREGTFRREAFDLFTQNPGAFITLIDPRFTSSTWPEEMRTYTLDIRSFYMNKKKVPGGKGGRGNAVYCLVGDDLGKEYVDHFYKVWGNSPADIVRAVKGMSK